MAATILVINPGSTSTKVALFAGSRCRFSEEVRHSRRALARAGGIIAQEPLRRRAVLKALRRHGADPGEIDVYVGRGGLLRPVPSGVYEVNDRMLADLRACRYGEHASNLGAILAADLARAHGKAAYIADPVVTDELADVARLSGLPGLPRRSVFHALSQKAAGRRAARRLGKAYEACNLIVAHVGGGVSVAAHRKGRVVDVNNALDGEGPFTPERTGGLAALAFYRHGLARGLDERAAGELITRKGGLAAYLGTNDCAEIERRIAAGDRRAKAAHDAFIYQVAKEIGAMAAALGGAVDAVVLTGGVVRGARFRRQLRRRIGFIAPVLVGGENSEMNALATAAREVYNGVRKPEVY